MRNLGRAEVGEHRVPGEDVLQRQYPLHEVEATPREDGLVGTALFGVSSRRSNPSASSERSACDRRLLWNRSARLSRVRPVVCRSVPASNARILKWLCGMPASRRVCRSSSASTRCARMTSDCQSSLRSCGNRGRASSADSAEARARRPLDRGVVRSDNRSSASPGLPSGEAFVIHCTRSELPAQLVGKRFSVDLGQLQVGVTDLRIRHANSVRGDQQWRAQKRSTPGQASLATARRR